MKNIRKNTIQKLNILIAGIFAGVLLIALQTTVGRAQIQTLVSGDVGSQELRKLTVESWDRDYSGQGYGWEMHTSQDVEPKPGTKERAPYKAVADSLTAEREVKLIKGTPIDLRENYGYDNANVLGLYFAFTFPGLNSVTIQPPDVDHYTNERIRYYLSENIAMEQKERKSCFKDPSLSTIRSSRRAVAFECVTGVSLPGKVFKISVWVMGRGDDYDLEIWLEDWKGNLHVLPLGSVDFIGWRPLSVAIPSNIPQDINTFPQTKKLVFRKFKLRSKKTTFTDPVYIFFDELRILANLFEVSYDGAQLDFDKTDCERKNTLYRNLRNNSRVPEQWPKLVDCSKSPPPARGGVQR